MANTEDDDFQKFYYNYNSELDFTPTNATPLKLVFSLKKAVSSYLYINKHINILNDIELADSYINNFFKRLEYYFKLNNTILINKSNLVTRLFIKYLLEFMYHINLIFHVIFYKNRR